MAKDIIRKSGSLECVIATFNGLEEIHAWQKARQVTRMIHELTAEGRFARDFGLSGQIQRASVSIMANIAEGFGRHSDKEFANYLNMAHGSASEVLSHLYVALDLDYIAQSSFDKVRDLLDEISRRTLVLARRLRASKP